MSKRRASINASQLMKSKKKKIQKRKAMNASILESPQQTSHTLPNPIQPTQKLPQPNFSSNFDPYILESEPPIFSSIDPRNIDLADPNSFDPPIILAPQSSPPPNSIIYDFQSPDPDHDPIATSTPNNPPSSNDPTTSSQSTISSQSSISTSTSTELKRLKKDAKTHKKNLTVVQKTDIVLFVTKEQKGDDRATETWTKYGRKSSKCKQPENVGHRSTDKLIKIYYENNFPLLFRLWEGNFDKICPVKARDVLKWKRNLETYGCVDTAIIEAGTGFPLHISAENDTETDNDSNL